MFFRLRERSSRTSRESDDLCGAVLHAVGDGEVESGIAQNFLTHFDVGAFHSNNDGNFDLKIFYRGDDTGGEDVATEDAAEDVDEDGFHTGIADENVKGVFINIFGGILRCDVLATGVVAAAKDLQVKVPVVVRMEGTNVEMGQKILRDSGLNFTIADGMKDGATKVVALAGGAR